MKRLRLLSSISKYIKIAWNCWAWGIIFILIGILIYFISPLITKSVFNVPPGSFQEKQDLQNTEILGYSLEYLSYGFMVLGAILSIIIGELFAGYGAFETVKLKNYDKNNTYYDYSGLAILSCFLLPFVFLHYLKLQIEKEIKYIKREEEQDDLMLSLISEDEWQSRDKTGKVEYLNYLLENNVIDEDEFKFLVREENLVNVNKKDLSKEFIKSNDLEKDMFENDDDENSPYYELEKDPSLKNSRNQNETNENNESDISSNEYERYINELRDN
ncbi:MAG: hypothetical protein K2G54_02790 [Malacoplasma sp.]|nr:hypothetical protein [Malacoplasma sp.]